MTGSRVVLEFSPGSLVNVQAPSPFSLTFLSAVLALLFVSFLFFVASSAVSAPGEVCIRKFSVSPAWPR